MQGKWIEIRDAGTFIPAIAMRQAYPFLEADRYLAARAGYGTDFDGQRGYVWLTYVENCMTHWDPNKWPGGGRTMSTAHRYLIENWDEVDSGAVVDVAFILGETEAPKLSESEGSLDRQHGCVAPSDSGHVSSNPAIGVVKEAPG